jgi:hypothetical protein
LHAISAAERSTESTRRNATRLRTHRPTPPSRARSLDSPHPRPHAPTIRCLLWTCQSCTKAAGTWGTSRLTVEAVPGAYATTSSVVPGGERDDPLLPSESSSDRLWQAPHGQRHPKPLERGHPTRRSSAGREGLPKPPRCSPLSPFGDANGNRDP